MSSYTLLAAGETAFDIIHQAKNASVMGLTSRGVFCSTEIGQVFFLSYEKWRGPLTANINSGTGSGGESRPLRTQERQAPLYFDRLSHGSVANFFPNYIRFEREDLTIHFKGVPTWKAIINPLLEGELSNVRDRLVRIAKNVIDQGNGKGWIGYLPYWAGLTNHLEMGDAVLGVELQNLADKISSGEGEPILEHIGNLLGRGSGLTPSGDDFVVGLLLGLRATAGFSPYFQKLIRVSDEVIQLARTKTTTLSANLIACSLEGQADERLVSVLDGMLWGSLPERESARRLIDYGGSSGGDTLLGMAMAIHLG